VPSKPETIVFRFEFETPVRFGGGKGASGLDQAAMTASSDSMFAALCLEWLQLHGEASLTELVNEVKNGHLQFSSLMPWHLPLSQNAEPEYYLPRPLLSGQSAAGPRNTQIKKQLKQIPWIAASEMAKYLAFVRTGEGEPTAFRSAFGMEVAWDRVNTRTGGDPEPYRVVAWQFKRDYNQADGAKSQKTLRDQPQMISGLYWIVRSESSQLLEQIREVLESLGQSGVGGKTSSGLGKFFLCNDQLNVSRSGRALESMLDDTSAPVQMLISTAAPDSDHDLATIEQPESRYLLVKREGFAASPAFVDPSSGNALKRKSCILIKEGSCFPKRLKGQVLDLSYGGLHPVYRSGVAMHVGLAL